MSNILYYSNYCSNCKNVLLTLSKTKLKTEIFYICIDKRKQGANGETILTLENGQTIIKPPSITKVPALLLINHGHRVLFGDDIYNHFRTKSDEINNISTMNNGEPISFCLDSLNCSGVMSDHFSYWDMSTDDLSAKGNGGIKQMYNYAVADDMNVNNIQTPPDNYVPDKIGKNVSISNLTKTRQMDIP